MLVSRKDAKARGAKRYFTGKLCKRGHLSERRVSNETCMACLRAQAKAWATSNPEKVAQASRRMRATNNAAYRKGQKKYRAQHRDLYRALTSNRRSARLARTPPWLNQAHLAEIEGQYHFAKVMEQITGQKHHVDHIEPLQGNDVSGLHVPWNLRVIPARENFAKGNRRIEAHGYD